jgi:hypothetical protein
VTTSTGAVRPLWPGFHPLPGERPRPRSSTARSSSRSRGAATCPPWPASTVANRLAVLAATVRWVCPRASRFRPAAGVARPTGLRASSAPSARAASSGPRWSEHTGRPRSSAALSPGFRSGPPAPARCSPPSTVSRPSSSPPPEPSRSPTGDIRRRCSSTVGRCSTGRVLTPPWRRYADGSVPPL